jgi:type II secretory pathway component GspD/PulD (secretin)
MKLKLCITLVGLVASGLAGFAQTTPAGEPPAATSVTTTNATAQPDAAAATPATPASPAAPAATDPAAQPGAPAKDSQAAEAPATLVAANNAAPGDTNAAPAAAAATNATPESAAAPAATGSTNAGTGPGAVIPLIVMDDVPLTDAIKNLARQAGLNYMLDPKVSFGQPDAQGHVTPQPTISIRWENVTAEQALTALLTTYNLQLVEDPKSKIARITVRDPAAPDPLITKVIQLKFSSPSNMVMAVGQVLTDKRSKVVADVRTSQLVVLATEKEMVEVDQLVDRLDTRTKQVLIEARLMEIQMNPTTAKGVDWTATLASQRFSFGNNGFTRAAGGKGVPQAPIESQGPGAASGNSVPGGLVDFPSLLMNLSAGSVFNPSFAFLNADGVAGALSFLNTYAETKVISAPRTVTLDNEKATIEVGTMYPIVNVTAGTANTTGGSQITYSNLTVKLDVTPRISANDFVNLAVAPSILRLGPTVDSIVSGVANHVNEFLIRQSKTAVLIPSGNTLVMAGLIEDNVNSSNVKVPVLGDIPVLGSLFRFDSKNRTKDNLVIFITPTIVQDADFQPTRTDFLKTPVPVKDEIEKDWSWWDSGKPRFSGTKSDSSSKYAERYSDVPPPSSSN